MKLRRDVFQAIADPTRRAILLLLATTQTMTAGAIAATFDSARPTISKHLQILVECGMIQNEKTGREIFYYIDAAGMKDIAAFIEPFRKMWDDRYRKLEAIMKNKQTKK